MRLVVAHTEFALPHAAVRYICRCGASHVEHGREAGLPQGWVAVEDEEPADPDYACPSCARKRRGGAAGAPAAP